ncbi:nickel pincer cofactor biosynthesis protein LarB [Thalassoroseus pseudoceratinae]|uniref:nickel pincer cofactor biosynthesis protein LarB n=1 Tax=Thalassoroseus pseudoceratinae TaxID=2713176 RepID=UPI001F0F34F4|nr:nickel pincer cofactor biosynthesis protein LarB [Thalassoroseus pseudoceratinae]
MTDPILLELLESFRVGGLNASELVSRLNPAMLPTTEKTESACVDLDRSRRCGFPEVIYCEGKTVEAVLEITRVLREHDQPVLGTRVTTEQAAAVHEKFPDIVYNSTARTIRSVGETQVDLMGRVPVITAGTTDRPVAEEALETLRWMGVETELLVDVGVAGPQRLLGVLPQLRTADAVIVAAGMEGALPSVVGGHMDCPVVAVPTSVGYGAGAGGYAALLGMLNSCAANVTVVNIDAGFKAGYVAGLIARGQTPTSS